jgi:GNAT superfamily N-acetyltransferase
MSTSAEHRLRDGTPVALRAVPYDDPVARELVARVQQEYVERYGGPDEAPVDPAEFVPPLGLFLVAEVGGEPAGCGAWRRHAEGDTAATDAATDVATDVATDADADVAEMKRVYVAPGFRRRGLAQVVVAELERTARRAGYRAFVLNSGDRQPEALALYRALGYEPVPGYGIYADGEGAVFLGKRLTERDATDEDATDEDATDEDATEEEVAPWAS